MTRSYKLLGSLEIEENGRLSPLMKSNKGCALIAYLIVTGQPQPRTEIADLLWPSSTKNSRLGNLRRLLGFIRNKAPELVITYRTLAFQPNPTTVVDYQQLQAALDQVETEPLNQERLQKLDQGLQRYRGDLLATFYLENVSYFNEWLSVAREKLRNDVWAAYEHVCAAYLANEAWEPGVAAARRWLALDDLNEAACRWLMRFLAGNGQFAAAQEQYENCCARLWEELAIEPEGTTRKLAERLAAQEPEPREIVLQTAVSWQPDPLPDPNQLTEPGALPPHAFLPYRRNEDFTGREADLIQLGQGLLPWQELPLPQPLPKGEEHISSPQGGTEGRRSVAITGIGGLGKTQLAVEFAYRYGRFFAGGVYWLSFAQAESITDQIDQIGGEQGMRLYTKADKLTLADRVGRVQQAWQETTPRLLIFDNCEEETLLQKWLPVSGGCRVLLTSRRGQWAAPLNVTSHVLHSPARLESIRFLKRTIGKIEKGAADELAAEVGDLPLALHLAGSFLQRYPTITVARYLEQLRSQGVLQHPSLQGDGSSESPTGHELHIARTFALNFEQLDPTDETDSMAQLLLACTVALAHGEPIPQTILLDALVDDPDDFMAELVAADGLARLITLGFLTASAKQSVQIHRLVAAYAAAELSELVAKGETAVATHLLQKLSDQFAKINLTAQLPLAATHLQKMAASGLARGDALGTQVAFWWGRYLRDAGNPQAAYETLTEAAAIRRSLFPEGDLILAEQLSVLGTLRWELGRNQEAWTDYEETIAIRRRLLGENHTLTAQSIQNLAILHARSGSFAEAKRLYQQALAIYEAIMPPDLMQIGRTLSNLGLLYRRMNDLVGAEARFKQSLDTWAKILPPDSPHIATTLSSIGVAAYFRGDYATAQAYHERGLEIRSRSLGRNHRATSFSLVNLGMIATQLGAYEQALVYYQEGLVIRQAQLTPDDPNIGNCLSYMGQHFFLAGDLHQAKQYLLEGLAIQELKRPNQPPTAATLVYLGKLALHEGEFEAAGDYFEQATRIQVARLAPEHIEMVDGIIGRGDLEVATGKLTAARQLYERALAILEKTAVPEHPDFPLLRRRLAALDEQ